MKRILIVDDEKDIREILRDLLEDLGEVVGVENGALALAQMQSSHFDLIVSDYNMPALNGMQLLKKMNEIGIKTPLIWITGRSTKDLVVDAWKEGVFDYIEKPFDLEQVRKSVITALSIETGSAEEESPGSKNSSSKVQMNIEISEAWQERALTRASLLGLSLDAYVLHLIKRDHGVDS
jgi:hypothetical protein